MTYATKKPHTYTMRVACPATTGIIAAVTSHLAGRGHYICGQGGWEEVATYVATWLEGK